MNNPLISDFNTPYGVPPFNLIKEEHFIPAFKLALENGSKEILTIVDGDDDPTFNNTIEAIENLGKGISQISNIFFNLNHANTNEQLQKIAKEVSPLITEFDNDIWLNEKLFKKVRIIYENRDSLSLDQEGKKLLDNMYKAFVRKGAMLSDNQKNRYREISKELSDLSLQFGENVLHETNDYNLHITEEHDLDGLPESSIEMAAEQAIKMQKEGWVFTLHLPSFLPFMKYSKRRDLRKELFIAFSSKCNHSNDRNNQQIIKKIVQLRLERVKLLGYTCYADFVLEERMAKSALKVSGFLNELLEASISFASEDIEEVKDLAIEDGLTEEFQKWDFAYYSEKLKEKKYSIDDEKLRPYFKLENVERGVFDLAGKLFGITFKRSNELPVYHNEVSAFTVFDEDGTFLSVLYIDYYPRSSKQGGAWMTSFRDQHIDQDSTEDIRPVISLVMNFTRPTASKPSLLTHNEVRTFLHEFGHALHGMLSKVKYESLSGTNVYRDFVELPSQLMENWSVEKEWLQSVAKHYITGEIIPDHYIERIIASTNFQSGYSMIRQLSFGLVDMAWHTLDTEYSGDVVSFEKEAMKRTKLLPDIEGTSTCASFSHIFNGGYAAGYYGYKWAEVLDADAYSQFKEQGIFNKEIASKYRSNILEKGGTAHPMELYKAFAGREPSVEPLLKRSGLLKEE